MVPLHIELASNTLRRVIKRLHFQLEIMLVCIRWYAAYPPPMATQTPPPVATSNSSTPSVV
jgi:hypothetical protein